MIHFLYIILIFALICMGGCSDNHTIPFIAAKQVCTDHGCLPKDWTLQREIGPGSSYRWCTPRYCSRHFFSEDKDKVIEDAWSMWEFINEPGAMSVNDTKKWEAAP